jgi:putative hemolysin
MSTDRSAFRLNPLLAEFLPPPIAGLVAAPLERLFAFDKLARLYADLPPTRDPLEFARAALARLGVRFSAAGAVEDIPAAGPLVVVSNHPFGGVEGLYLYTLLAARRPDVRVLGNRMLARVPEFAPLLFPVDALAGRSATGSNAMALRAALRWVGTGGALLVFPAGAVSELDPLSRTVVDPSWDPAVARLIALTRAPVLPVYVDGGNSPWFHAAGFLYPRLRNALLARELVRKRERTVEVRVGRLLTARQVEHFDGDRRLIEHLRLRVYALAGDCGTRVEPAGDRAPVDPAVAVPADHLVRELAALAPARCLARQGVLEVWHATQSEAPWLMQEIGRLREVAGRADGAGSGQSRDIELYDRYYEQLVVWDAAARTVVAGCRLGDVGRIRAHFGSRGVHTSTLFRFHRGFLPALGPALEIGRPFVATGRADGVTPLALLWKGIGAHVVRHPGPRVLFGAVGLAATYSEAARSLLTAYLVAQHADPGLGRLVRARQRPANPRAIRLLRREAAEIPSLEALEAVLGGIDGDGKGIPEMLRQYLKLGARVLAVSSERAAGHAPHVLLGIDLDAADDRMLVRFLGRDDAAQFRAARGVDAPLAARAAG